MDELILVNLLLYAKTSYAIILLCNNLTKKYGDMFTTKSSGDCTGVYITCTFKHWQENGSKYAAYVDGFWDAIN